MTSKYLVIADDFTGANDTGVQMKNRGIDVDVTLFPQKEKIDSSIVLDTESRNLSAVDAYNKVKRMSQEILEENKFDLVYKKIDSTLRGNIVEEIRAVSDVYKPDKIVFAPALPEVGRTTEKGIHQLNNIPLMETEFAKDPLSPILNDNIIEILEDGFNEKVKHHTNSESINLEDAKYHTFDAVTQTDLLSIADALLDSSQRILWVGSAGLANAFFQSVYPLKPSLGVVGSISEKSLIQMKYAESNGVEVMKVENKELFNKENIEIVGKKAIDILNRNGKLIITAAKTRSDYEESLRYGEELGLDHENTGWYVMDFLSRVTNYVLSEIELSGLFLTGGSTAISVMDAINTTRVSIQSELLTGIVHSTLSDGLYKDVNIVTKAGGFGDEEDILYCLEKIREM